MSDEEKVSITVLLPGGRLPLDIMDAALQIAQKYRLGVYLSTLQNLRFLDVPVSLAEEIRETLAASGMQTSRRPESSLFPGSVSARIIASWASLIQQNSVRKS